MAAYYGGIEAGGTKFVCAVAAPPEDIRAETRFSTTNPEDTLRQAIDFFKDYQYKEGNLGALGVASFGPVDLDPNSPQYGHITTTPKPGWKNIDVVGRLRDALNLPIGFDTDVNGAAIGEKRWGAAEELDTFLYLTIGTGIGGGGMVNGRLMHGLLHPEMGHIRIPHDWERDPFEGVCSYHGDCLEGLSNGPAIEKRWGQPGETLPNGHPAWDLESEYLALALMNYICILSPQCIILGGGVMKQSHLLQMVRKKTQELLNGYIQKDQIINDIDQYIVPPGLGSKAGLMGAIALGIEAAERI